MVNNLTMPAEELVALCPLQGRYGLPERVDGLPIRALGLVGEAEVAIRQRVQDALPTRCGEREGTLGGGDGLIIRAHEAKLLGQKARDLSQPTRVVESQSEGLGLVQTCQSTL